MKLVFLGQILKVSFLLLNSEIILIILVNDIVDVSNTKSHKLLL
jgi:hypothetical protein